MHTVEMMSTCKHAVPVRDISLLAIPWLLMAGPGSLELLFSPPNQRPAMNE